MEINIKLAVIILVFLFVVFPSLTLTIFYRKKRFIKIVGIISFVLYCSLLSLLVFGSLQIKGDIVSLSIKKNASWFSMNFLFANFGKTNILYNLVMLFPIGAFILSQTENKTFLKTALVSFIVSLSIEVLQFILPVNRTTELFDIVLNVLSGIIGYFYFYTLIKLCNRKTKSAEGI